MGRFHGGITITGLAKLAKMPQSHVYYLVNGRYHGRPDDLIKIADILGLDPTKLIYIDLQPPDEDRDTKLAGITKDHATIMRLWDLLQGDTDHAERWRHAIDLDWMARHNSLRTRKVLAAVRAGSPDATGPEKPETPVV